MEGSYEDGNAYDRCGFAAGNIGFFYEQLI
jgi:hypothetical protein